MIVFLILILLTNSIICDSCGNGVIDGKEQCDHGNQNGEIGNCCNIDCTFHPRSHMCRPSTNSCDIPEYCSGYSGYCPPNRFEPDGRQSEGCDGVKTCERGVLIKFEELVCPPSTSECIISECNPSTEECELTVKPSDTLCNVETSFCEDGEWKCNSRGECIQVEQAPECESNDACIEAFCDEQQRECVERAIEGCCEENAACINGITVCGVCRCLPHWDGDSCDECQFVNAMGDAFYCEGQLVEELRRPYRVRLVPVENLGSKLNETRDGYHPNIMLGEEGFDTHVYDCDCKKVERRKRGMGEFEYLLKEFEELEEELESCRRDREELIIECYGRIKADNRYQIAGFVIMTLLVTVGCITLLVGLGYNVVKWYKQKYNKSY